MNVSTHEGIRLIRLDRRFLGRRLMSVVVYHVDGLLVDAGYARARRELAAALSGLEIGACVLTHHHEDHSGNGAWLRRSAGVTPMAHPAARSFLSDAMRLQPYRRFFWGTPEPFVPLPVGSVVETKRHRFEVVDLSGHCRDMIGLHEKERGWLFPGDLFVMERPTHFMPNDEYEGIVRSLRRALSLDFGALLCAHSPRLDDGKRALRAKLEFLEDLGGRAAFLLGRGRPPEAVRDELLGGEDYISWFTGGHFSKINLIRSIAASLGLEDEKKAIR